MSEENTTTTKSKSSLKPTSKPFTFNPGASSFIPGGSFTTPPPPPAPAPETSSTSEEIVDSLSNLRVESNNSSTTTANDNNVEKGKEEKEIEEEDFEDDDENDPLYQCVLKLAKGDKSKAEEMLLDDTLHLKYPEVKAIMESESNFDKEEGLIELQEVPVKFGVTSSSTNHSSSKEKQKDFENTKSKGKGEEQENEEEEEGVSSSTDMVFSEEELGEEDPREHLNLVFMGHVDAGKSTMSGQILYLTGQVDKRTIERFEREAKAKNRESWFLAFIMDVNEEEREKGKTVEVGRAQFDTEKKRYTIMDAPGHKSYVPNMITGAAQADVGILVISARKGEFETGFERGGQTQEHAVLAKTLGVKHLVVVVNKMDDPTVNWSKERFDECTTKLKPFLKACGYAPRKDVKFLPVSAFKGSNILEAVDSNTCPWWSGYCSQGENNTKEMTLIDCLDNLQMSEWRKPDGPLRIPVLDRYHERGTIVLGKVESGTLVVGRKVTVMPNKGIFRVGGIWIGDSETVVKSAKPGENSRVKLDNCGPEQIAKGSVISNIEDPARISSKFDIQIAILDMPEKRNIISAGFTCILHAHCIEEECVITDIISLSARDGTVKKKPRFVRVKEQCVVRIQVRKKICGEPFDTTPSLGRVTLRDEGKTLAIGKIVKVIGGKKKTKKENKETSVSYI